MKLTVYMKYTKIFIMKNRIILFDIMKALCVIEIVAFWHMFDYTSIDADDVMFGGSLTSTVLAVFTFASGFFLGKKKVSIGKFYSARIQRFMLPLLVSLLIMYAFGVIDSFRTVVFSAIGISCFIPPMAPTLWYFSMIILCYLFTPLILWGVGKMNNLERVVNIMIRGLLLFAFMMCIDIQPKVQAYFLFYIFGMVIDSNCIRFIVNTNIICKMGGVIAWLLLSYLKVGSMVTDALGVLLLICFSNFIEAHSNDRMKSLFEKIAYASMFAYLFHREFYQITKRLFHLLDGTIPVYGIIITVILIFVLSYYGQKIYDLMISKIKIANK